MPHSPETPPAQSIFSRQPILTAVVVGILSLAPHFFLSRELSIAFAALLLSLIAGIYFGFAVVNGNTREQLIEFATASIFVVAALLGFVLTPAIIAVAYLCHALWDILHHNRLRLSLVAIPQWYVPWCVIIDVIVGAGLLVVWRAHSTI